MAAGFSSGVEVGGRWLLGEQLGQGAFGQVYRADDTSTLNLGAAAVKVLHPSTSPKEREAFHEEIRKVVALRHPNLVAYLDSGEHRDDDGQPHLFLVTELCRYSLQAYLAGEPGRLTSDQAERLLADIASGLGYLHSRGLLHRDLKPANVLLGGDDWKLGDFGLSRAMSATGHYHHGTVVMGTPRYMAPELFDDGAASAASDVYAVGVTLHQALTGRTVHEGSDVALLIQVTTRPPAIDRDLPPHWRKLIERCLDREPGNRPGASQLPAVLAESRLKPSSRLAELSGTSPLATHLGRPLPPPPLSAARRHPSAQPAVPPPDPASLPAPSSGDRAPHPADLASLPAPPDPASLPAPSTSLAGPATRDDAALQFGVPSGVWSDDPSGPGAGRVGGVPGTGGVRGPGAGDGPASASATPPAGFGLPPGPGRADAGGAGRGAVNTDAGSGVGSAVPANAAGPELATAPGGQPDTAAVPLGLAHPAAVGTGAGLGGGAGAAGRPTGASPAGGRGRLALMATLALVAVVAVGTIGAVLARRGDKSSDDTTTDSIAAASDATGPVANNASTDGTPADGTPVANNASTDGTPADGTATGAGQPTTSVDPQAASAAAVRVAGIVAGPSDAPSGYNYATANGTQQELCPGVAQLRVTHPGLANSSYLFERGIQLFVVRAYVYATVADAEAAMAAGQATIDGCNGHPMAADQPGDTWRMTPVTDVTVEHADQSSSTILQVIDDAKAATGVQAVLATYARMGDVVVYSAGTDRGTAVWYAQLMAARAAEEVPPPKVEPVGTVGTVEPVPASAVRLRVADPASGASPKITDWMEAHYNNDLDSVATAACQALTPLTSAEGVAAALQSSYDDLPIRVRTPMTAADHAQLIALAAPSYCPEPATRLKVGQP